MAGNRTQPALRRSLWQLIRLLRRQAPGRHPRVRGDGYNPPNRFHGIIERTSKNKPLSQAVRAVAEKVFGITIDGQEVSPSSVRLRDLYELMNAFEAAVAITAAQKQGSKADVSLRLVSISSGSANYRLAISPDGYSAAVTCAKAIASRDLSGLPQKARESILFIKSRTTSRGWAFRTSGDNGMPVAEITEQTEFTTDAIIAGTTSISGKLLRIGGMHPTAQLLLPDGRRLTADIATEELAMRLSPLLYRFIAVEGEARWTTADWFLVDFKITALAEYDAEINLMATLDELATISDGFWDEIDPDDYIARLRSEAD